MECFKGPDEIKQKFEMMIKETIGRLDEKELTTDIEHEINLTVENPKNFCRPYRLSLDDKKYLEKNIKEC